MDPEKRRALSEFYREEFLRYLEFFKASGILHDGNCDAMQRTYHKLMADLELVCWRSEFPAVAETLLLKFETLSRLSEIDPRQAH